MPCTYPMRNFSFILANLCDNSRLLSKKLGDKHVHFDKYEKKWECAAAKSFSIDKDICGNREIVENMRDLSLLENDSRSANVVAKDRSVEVVVSVVAKGLLAAYTVDRVVWFANSVCGVSGQSIGDCLHVGLTRCRAATDFWPVRSVPVGTAESLACSRIAGGARNAAHSVFSEAQQVRYNIRSIFNLRNSCLAYKPKFSHVHFKVYELST